MLGKNVLYGIVVVCDAMGTMPSGPIYRPHRGAGGAKFTWNQIPNRFVREIYFILAVAELNVITLILTETRRLVPNA